MNNIVQIINNDIVIAEKICKEIADFEKLKMDMDLKQKELKQQLKEAMEKVGITSWDNEYFKVTIKKSYKQNKIDSKTLKEDLPDIYNAYSKKTNVSGSISLEVK